MRSVHILRLVHQQLLTFPAPAPEEGRAGFQKTKRPNDEIVEVEPAGILERLLICEECPGDAGGLGVLCDLLCRDADLQFEPAEGVIQPADGADGYVRPHVAEHDLTVQQRLHGLAAVGQYLAAEGVERLDADCARGEAERLQRGINARGHLVGGSLVEGDRSDGGWVGAGGHEPGNACYQGRCLAASGRGNAQHGPRRRGGSLALIGREAFEAFGDGRGEHRPMIAGAPLPALIWGRRATAV